LATLFAEIRRRELDIKRLVFVSSNTEADIRWCGLARGMIRESSWPTAELEPRYAESPLQVAAVVSNEVELARLHGASLIADLTLGPKDRSAAIYVASSALQSVTILYAERQENGFRHREVPPIDNFNTWLARHGVLIRDYKKELAGLNVISGTREYHRLNGGELDLAIADLLVNSSSEDMVVAGPRTNLLTLIESVRDSVWRKVMDCPRPHAGAIEDQEIRSRERDEWHRSAGRAAQALWILRALFAHGQPNLLQAERPDAIAMLDFLSFLSSRLKAASADEIPSSVHAMPEIIVALDGDDVGRRFEERLASCSDVTGMDELAEWSYGIQADLIFQMAILRDRWSAVFLARTGDGFLARLPAAHLENFKKEFRPTLLDASATIGVGPTVKDAYLALKLAKAKNRGGGLFYSLATGQEEILWSAPAVGGSEQA